MEVTAKAGPEGPEISVNYEFGEDTKAMTELFGDKIVFDNARANMVVSLQGFIRSRAKRGDKPAEIQKAVAEWKPGTRVRGKSKAEKFKEQFESLSADEKKAMLAQLTK